MTTHAAADRAGSIAPLGVPQVDRVERLQRLATVARARFPGSGVPFFAHLRVRTGGRIREVLLGERADVSDTLAIVDWEAAPLAEAFFGYEEGEEYEIDVGRRTLTGEILERSIVRFRDGELDEVITADAILHRGADGAWTAIPRLPVPSLRRRDAAARSRPAVPLVVTLDATQREAVDLAEDRCVLVLGEAGFGKTTVALHRIARLRTLAREAGRPFKALVVVPTEGLRRLSEAMLWRLSVEDIEVAAFESWIIAQARRVFVDVPSRTSQDAKPAVGRLKRHPAVRVALPSVAAGIEAMRQTEDEPSKPWATHTELLHLWGDRELLQRIAGAAGDLGDATIEAVLAHTRIQFSETTEEAMSHVDADRLRTLDRRRIDEGTPMQDAGSVDVEDLPVLFELNRAKTGTDATPAGALQTYDHVVVDEAQEFAPLELAVLGRAVSPGGGLTVAGDARQQVDPTTHFVDWSTAMRELGRTEYDTIELEESYRCPPSVEAFARGLFGGNGTAVDQSDGSIATTRFEHACHLATQLITTLRDVSHDDRKATIAVVYRRRRDAQRWASILERGLTVRLALDGDFDFKPGISVTCVDEVKGLEFDFVVVPDASASVYPDSDAARRALYVAVTRTTHQLWLATDTAWSPLVVRSMGLPV